SFDARIAEAYLRCLGRKPTAPEIDRLRQFHDERHAQYAADASAAKLLVGKRATGDHAETAAWIATARVLMNLDEFITRE
ncbi:MAG TPA: hypothetical protein VG713_08550, partial [Pirellulales bacterium]|nr:hypothetical protein [Pirellulales bacterium]